MRILVADDDQVFQLLLGRTLRKWGYHPVVVGDGKEAYRHLASVTGPRLAILDWMMPEPDGLEVCRLVRGASLPYPVYLILLTSKSDPYDSFSGYDAGADDYVSKPVEMDDLKGRIETGLDVLKAKATIDAVRRGTY